MSRPIKFRVYDQTSKDYIVYGMGKVVDEHFGLGIISRIVWWLKGIKHKFIIEQYTGLKDKNGKEIYEGDIVFFFTEHFDKATGGFDGEDEHNATVEWFDSGFAFMDKIPYDPNIECEVIGNIHENPELLEKEVKNE